MWHRVERKLAISNARFCWTLLTSVQWSTRSRLGRNPLKDNGDLRVIADTVGFRVNLTGEEVDLVGEIG